mmetsp:Transcript_1674/g.7308  ORF Transcript_1674/g.7308 Transcript_1674/m.7308 type:complete len:808 (+) Transcript_1674:345-2768(+)
MCGFWLSLLHGLRRVFIGLHGGDLLKVLESRLLEGVLVEGRDLLLVRVLVVVRGDLERQIRGVPLVLLRERAAHRVRDKEEEDRQDEGPEGLPDEKVPGVRELAHHDADEGPLVDREEELPSGLAGPLVHVDELVLVDRVHEQEVDAREDLDHGADELEDVANERTCHQRRHQHAVGDGVGLVALLEVARTKLSVALAAKEPVQQVRHQPGQLHARSLERLENQHVEEVDRRPGDGVGQHAEDAEGIRDDVRERVEDRAGRQGDVDVCQRQVVVPAEHDGLHLLAGLVVLHVLGRDLEQDRHDGEKREGEDGRQRGSKQRVPKLSAELAERRHDLLDGLQRGRRAGGQRNTEEDGQGGEGGLGDGPSVLALVDALMNVVPDHVPCFRRSQGLDLELVAQQQLDGHLLLLERLERHEAGAAGVLGQQGEAVVELVGHRRVLSRVHILRPHGEAGVGRRRICLPGHAERVPEARALGRTALADQLCFARRTLQELLVLLVDHGQLHTRVHLLLRAFRAFHAFLAFLNDLDLDRAFDRSADLVRLLHEHLLDLLDLLVEDAQDGFVVRDLLNFRGATEAAAAGEPALEHLRGGLLAQEDADAVVEVRVVRTDHHGRLVWVVQLVDVQRLQLPRDVLPHVHELVHLLALHGQRGGVHLAGEEVLKVAVEHGRGAQVAGQILHHDAVHGLEGHVRRAMGQELIAQLGKVLVFLRDAVQRVTSQDVPDEDRRPKLVVAILEVGHGGHVELVVQVLSAGLVGGDEHDEAADGREEGRAQVQPQVAQHDVGVQASQTKQLLVGVHGVDGGEPTEG